VITSLLFGRRPNIPAHSVCFECKQRGNVCVVVAHGTPCLGPVTHAGCSTDCAAYGGACTPRSPLGAPMVSSEGTCAAYFNAGRPRRTATPIAGGAR